jgi:hypothetical protein
MSALPSKADIVQHDRDVPEADIRTDGFLASLTLPDQFSQPEPKTAQKLAQHYGLESASFPLPLTCSVLYCDRNAYKEIWADSTGAALSGRLRGCVWRLRPDRKYASAAGLCASSNAAAATRFQSISPVHCTWRLGDASLARTLEQASRLVVLQRL